MFFNIIVTDVLARYKEYFKNWQFGAVAIILCISPFSTTGTLK